MEARAEIGKKNKSKSNIFVVSKRVKGNICSDYFFLFVSSFVIK